MKHLDFSDAVMSVCDDKIYIRSTTVEEKIEIASKILGLASKQRESL